VSSWRKLLNRELVLRIDPPETDQNPLLQCWLKSLNTYKLLLGNSCSKGSSLLVHITQAVMVMICYLYQNWEESD